MEFYIVIEYGPWIYGVIVVALLIAAFFIRRSRQILLWVLIPQWVTLGLLILTLYHLNILTDALLALYMLLPFVVWAGLLPALALGWWPRRVLPVWLLCHSLFAAAFFMLDSGDLLGAIWP
ncbi:hypothetical protein CHU32_14510 [Superficieibacter electus]|uniref:Uncharacterized protein n=1 Tax=Superficieibacter electus TaxID=2022662 RepID=A0A2P5GNC6_9ENTR|nr:hypothetical protein [Superficieibacter electus]MDU4436592.1 hypothetical protein [Pluralibacter gergoviae]POP43582.1 hypothetical protein CHU33_15220 [Superficieibacter electus]POP48050.1 hypothetical protein CHU32_14510 [Superficieibacter electus]